MNSTENTVNIAVGKISDAAREAILACGGRIEATKKPSVSMVLLPSGTELTGSDDSGAFIPLPEPSQATLRFTRAWETEDCSLDLCGTAQ